MILCVVLLSKIKSISINGKDSEDVPNIDNNIKNFILLENNLALQI